MDKEKSIRTWLFQKIWNEEKILGRKPVMYVVIPLLLTIAMLLIVNFTKKSITMPYLLFFAIILTSACYGGYKSSMYASIITFIAGLLLLFIPVAVPVQYIGGHVLRMIVFFIEALLITSLIYRFQFSHQENIAHLITLEEREQELIFQDKDHHDFVHMAAHELKSPVTVLKAYLQLVGSRLLKEGRQDDMVFVEKMDVQLDKLLNLISDLLDAASISSGTLNCLMNDFNFNECLHDCIEGIKAVNPSYEITYKSDVTDLVVKGDRDRIEQIVTNLINNAIKYSPTEKFVNIQCITKMDEVLVLVTDKGIGIPAEKQKHIFERFYRADTPLAQRLPGLGLGLFICAQIILKHKGKIGVKSETGKGSTFWFSLPLKN